ncbi:hypothetical protein LMTR13_24410 [Bradyrhizobium icense]|uniref:Uncharacterized protein n=1 Tax=Bradyrhizobium icense TaxID=1274631 RepID=A0A1B1UJ55_9BRAD|nr:hypothetical protein LMTR13_24410 [Bradyrhizobium icense]
MLLLAAVAWAKAASLIDEPIPMFQLGDEGGGPLDRTTCLKTLFWLFAFVRCELDKRHDLAAFRHHP